jgi:cardiolipin synthase
MSQTWIELLIGGIILLLHTAGLLLALQAVLISRTSGAAIAWALGLFICPYVTIPLFLVFGESKFAGYALAGDGHSLGLDQALERAQTALEPHRASFNEKYADASRLVEHLNRLPPTEGNHVSLLVDGKATFDAIFAAIDEARDYLIVQFFIIRDDGIGRALKAHLLAAGARGVRIWMLYDQVGTRHLPRAYRDELTRAGVDIRCFVTNRQFGKRFRINFRNHRKLVICDGRIAFIGGQNIGDEYLGLSKRFGPWRDTFIRITGPAAVALQVPFVEDWRFATGDVPDVSWNPAPAEDGRMRVFTIPSSPAAAWTACSAAYLETIHDVRRRLWVASPYFVPEQSLRVALAHAALRGVDVRLLLPQNPDHLLTWLSSFSFYPGMREAGVKIFRYQPGFMHQKVLLADDDLAIIGSINLDYRSFMLNFELSAAINDRTFARRVERMFEDDFTRAKQEDLAVYESAGILFRLKTRLAALLSPQQ